MLSADMFRKFEIPFLMRIADNFQGLFIHTHSVGSHVIPVLCELDKVRFIEISNDPNAPRSIDIYKKYEKELEGRIVIVTLRRSEVEQNIDFLRDKKTVIWYDAQSVKDASEAIDLIRKVFE
jgi:predicted ribosome quality control (RQC) complex YloA/Tae2 family protein